MVQSPKHNSKNEDISWNVNKHFVIFYYKEIFLFFIYRNHFELMSIVYTNLSFIKSNTLFIIIIINILVYVLLFSAIVFIFLEREILLTVSPKSNKMTIILLHILHK